VTSLLEGAIVLGFPALAAWAVRAGGGRRLWLLTVTGLAVLAALALVAASERFGNRLAPQYGYGYTAPRTLLVTALQGGLPMLGAALAIHGGRRRIARTVPLYMVGVVTALVALLFGTILALYLLPALA
jgi:hypothetical protein